MASSCFRPSICLQNGMKALFIGKKFSKINGFTDWVEGSSPFSRTIMKSLELSTTLGIFLVIPMLCGLYVIVIACTFLEYYSQKCN